ncbi:hypothetical protein FO519_007460 [Halicephalobus sp. NKZ332]|nr:hypothetical protein FO519_007460 [Halicephalobus sp. NKZ332]
MFPPIQELRPPTIAGTSLLWEQGTRMYNKHSNNRFCQSDLSEEKSAFRSSKRMSINSIQRLDSPRKPNYGLAAVSHMQRNTSISASTSGKIVQVPLSAPQETVTGSELDESYTTWKPTKFPVSRTSACEFAPETSKLVSFSFKSKQTKISVKNTELHSSTNTKTPNPSKTVNSKNGLHIEKTFSKSISEQASTSSYSVSPNPSSIGPSSLQKSTKESTSTDIPWENTFNYEDPPIYPPFQVSEEVSDLLDVVHGFRHLIDKYAVLPKIVIVGKIYLVKHPQTEDFYRGRVLKIEGNQLFILLTDFFSAFLIEKRYLREYPNVREWMLPPSY